MTILTFHHLKIRISYSQKKMVMCSSPANVPMNGGVKLHTSILNWWNSRCETQSLRCQAVSHGDPRWPALARRSRRCVRRLRWVSRHRDRRRVPMSTRGCRNFPTWVQWVVILLQCLLVWSLCLWVEWCHMIFGGFWMLNIRWDSLLFAQLSRLEQVEKPTDVLERKSTCHLNLVKEKDKQASN